MRTIIIALLLITINISSLLSKPTLATCFGNGMVLQRDIPVKIWGTANPGEKLQIEFQQKKYKTKADQEGNWMLSTEALNSGGPFKLVAKGKKGKHELSEVFVGEVWIAGGQSNMEFNLSRSTNGQKYVQSATNENIRFLYIPRPDKIKNPEDNELIWKTATKENVGRMSAVAYHFATKIQPEINVPVGIICCYRGGSAAELWISGTDLQAHPQLITLVKTKKSANNQSGNESKKNDLYSEMLSRIIPFTAKGVIWYQGEANVSRAEQYKTLFPFMIKSWRTYFQQSEMPFYFVQLPKFGVNGAKNTNWAELREAQLETLKNTSNTGMAVILDCGEENNLHPKNKQPVGERLARIALAKNYGKDIPYSGPLFKNATINGNKIVLSFDYSENGFNTAGVSEVNGFEISEDGKTFVKATATIDDKVITVYSDEIKSPIELRYGWSNFTDANLYNNDRLMASPFRVKLSD